MGIFALCIVIFVIVFIAAQRDAKKTAEFEKHNDPDYVED